MADAHPPSERSRPASGPGPLAELLPTFGVYLVAVLLIVAGAFVSDQFLTLKNQLDMLRGIALLGMVACGMAFVTYSGCMADLSVPSAMAFAGIVAVAALPLGLVPALLLGVLAGMAVGAVNGLVVGYLRANPILWTLAVAFFMEGLMRFAWSNNQVYPDEHLAATVDFIALFRCRAGPLPVYVLMMILLFVAGQIVMSRARFGIEARLVGSASEAARTSGINVPRVVLAAFVLCSFTASLAGIFITSMNKLGVFYLGQGYDFRGVTAVVLGGVTLKGGRGNLMGVLGGVLVIGLLSNILTFVGLNDSQQNLVTGCVFVAVVGLQQWHLRRLGRDYG